MALTLILGSIVMIIVLITYIKLHPFLSLILVSLTFGLAAGMEPAAIIGSIKQGFGDTLGSVGLIIIIGIMIGTFLEKSGGAMTLAVNVLRLVGEKRINTAMGVIGYIISVPVFADSGFILLSSLTKSLAKKAGASLSGPAVALAIGLTVTHNLVPPTPGPIAAAQHLGADLGIVILLGIPIAIVCLVVGLVFAQKVAAKVYLDPSFDEKEEGQQAEILPSPSLFTAMLPIVIPLVLIVLASLAGSMGKGWPPALLNTVLFVGNPLIALLIGLALCLFLTKVDAKNWSDKGWIGQALKDCTSVLLITGAGGVFGLTLRNSELADVLGETLKTWNLGIILPFIVSAMFKSSQGSSTVALNTTAAMMSGLMLSLGFVSEIDKALVVVAIGSGSMVVSHSNDSFFWVVTQMTGMDIKTGYKLHTLGTLVIGLTAITCVFILFTILH